MVKFSDKGSGWHKEGKAHSQARTLGYVPGRLNKRLSQIPDSQVPESVRLVRRTNGFLLGVTVSKHLNRTDTDTLNEARKVLDKLEMETLKEGPFPQAIQFKVNDLIEHFDDITTSDLQGAVGAICMNDNQLDEDEMLDYIYERVHAKQKTAQR